MSDYIPREVGKALDRPTRQEVRDRVIEDHDAADAIEHLLALDLQRHSHEGLLERAWSMRKNITVYDAIYVALAEALGAPLITCDRRLSRRSTGRARIQVVT